MNAFVQRSRVGKAKRAHANADGGHALLCPTYNSKTLALAGYLAHKCLKTPANTRVSTIYSAPDSATHASSASSIGRATSPVASG